MKNVISFEAPFVIAAILLSACAPFGNGNKPDCTIPGAFCVGLVTDIGPLNDGSFNQSAWGGVLAAQKDLGATVEYIATTDVKDYDKNISTFTDEGYQVIVTVGSNQTEATYNAAKNNPKTLFIGIDQTLSKDANHPDWPLSNLVGLVFPEDEAGFLVGALGAMMSKTHEVGAICATDSIHQIWRYCEGYKAGVTYIDTQKNINTTVTVDYHNDVNFDKTFTDPEWGASTAISMIKNGADVIFGVGGRTGTGALLATAQERAYAIGVDADQYYTLPDAREYLLTSAIKLIEPGVETLIKSAKEGTFQGGSFTGEAGYAPYHDLDNQVPTGVKTEMEIILKGLQDGTIKTNVPISKPGT